jgi:threonine/homoserine/homoserine lactone efflux protein
MNVTGVALSLLMLASAAYLLWAAWMMVIRKRSILFPPQRFGLWVLRLLKGEHAAQVQQARLSTELRTKVYGATAFFGGLLLLWIAVDAMVSALLHLR